ncbi:unnamed protein product [Periconia digitata]|uniref:Cytochrome c oxidase subunit n=1 Tax=Periconia digitata TaxID=1303443 RepID=A0A9W4XWD4_9PLEO|nr:unnamed protein product [Periconia digitata]
MDATSRCAGVADVHIYACRLVRLLSTRVRARANRANAPRRRPRLIHLHRQAQSSNLTPLPAPPIHDSNRYTLHSICTTTAEMFAPRTLLRSSQRLALARPPVRSVRFYSSESPRKFSGAEDNDFNRERAEHEAHAGESGELWRKLSIYVAIPCIIIACVNGKIRWDAHWEHQAHAPPMSERPEYPYQNIRTKNFFWGDGDKTLFWNDKVNYHKKDDE